MWVLQRFKYYTMIFISWLYNKICCRLLEDRISRLHGQLQRIHQQSCSENDTTILDFLNEDIHWLVMIAGICTKIIIVQFIILYCHQSQELIIY